MTRWEKRSERWLWWSFERRMPCRDFRSNLGAGFMPKGHSHRWLTFNTASEWRFRYRVKSLPSHRIQIGATT